MTAPHWLPAKRGPKRYAEHAEQSALFLWAQLRQLAVPELALLFAIGNWAGVKSPIEGAARKKEGTKAGVPDVCLPVARGEYHGLYIEMKAGKNQATKAQRWWLRELQRQGYRAEVCRGFQEARKTIEEYLAA